ncbi:MAG: putative porin [Candidatus Omnitrophica bacterium]|nr:putative porin [Candidatus Omnitrophota bacterium]
MKKFLVLAAAGFAVLCLIGSSSAGEIDLLLQKLVDKGVLTAGEAQQVKTETKEDIRKEIAQAKYDLLPEWLQRVKMKGDFRLRYANTKQKATKDDSKGQIRVRLGVDTKINDQMKVGVGLATGSTSNPRSTNATFADSNGPASFKSIILDYAYGSYSPTTWLTLTGGKFKNPIWQPNDLLWDTDLNPEGVNMQLDYRLNPYLGLFLNAEIFALTQDSSSSSGRTMWVVQPGVKYNWKDKVDFKAAVATYLFTNLKGKGAFTNEYRTNSVVGGQYQYNYNSFNPSVEIGIKDPFAGVPLLSKYVPYAGIFGDFIYNPDPQTGKSGFDAGLKFGQEKVGDWGQWQAKVLFAKLGRDAWLDILPDSDRYNGKTNMKSAEGIFEYGLNKNSSLVVDYYWAESLTKTNGNFAPQQVIQIDWNLKW